MRKERFQEESLTIARYLISTMKDCRRGLLRIALCREVNDMLLCTIMVLVVSDRITQAGFGMVSVRAPAKR